MHHTRIIGIAVLYVVLSTHEASAQTLFYRSSGEKWSYVTVRPNAHMFWWMYQTTGSEDPTSKPLVMWLQGGPGGSSTGFGNFGEIGPLDVSLKPRPTTWLNDANLLFVDNPVGAGFSYVTDDNAYATTNEQIATDLLAVLKAVLQEMPEFQAVPFYIFCESYGGKMTAGFSQVLHKAISAGSVKCNFQGFALGDSWISPIDSVLTWGPYLYSTSLVDEAGLAKVMMDAERTLAALEAGNFTQSTELWSQTEGTISSVTNGVNFYNILDWAGSEPGRIEGFPTSFARAVSRHLYKLQDDALSKLMNGPIREKLGIIPANVTWGAESGTVFEKLKNDFMKPVVDVVDDLVTNTTLKVVVYTGQLDLIVDTLGTERWIQKLSWPGLSKFNGATRKAIILDNYPKGFYKESDNFALYWILDAGHMVPADAGDAALKMLQMIVQSS